MNISPFFNYIILQTSADVFSIQKFVSFYISRGHDRAAPYYLLFCGISQRKLLRAALRLWFTQTLYGRVKAAASFDQNQATPRAVMVYPNFIWPRKSRSLIPPKLGRINGQK